MTIEFEKMQGCGNDFIVIDNQHNNYSVDLLIKRCPRLCDRKFGIGADGLLILNPSKVSGTNYEMIYRNADGSDAGMCGNGGRCIAAFAQKVGFDSTHRFSVHSNTYEAKVDTLNNQVKITWLHLKTHVNSRYWHDEKPLDHVYTGTEHEVFFCDVELNNAQQVELGKAIRSDKSLNETGCNVNFIQRWSHNELEVVTYERGVEDLTLACGTGALASAIAWHKNYVDSPKSEWQEVLVSMPGGKLSCTFSYNEQTKEYTQLSLSGEVQFVFTGSIRIEE